MKKRLRLGVLASGRGSNLQALLDRCADGRLAAEVAVVVSNVPDSYALERASRVRVPAVTVDHHDFADRVAHDSAIVATLQSHGAELVALAGYLRIFSSPIFAAYGGRIVNIHPSLIPAFCGKNMHGLRVHQAVIEYGAKITGVTIHFVEPEVDTGPIILQACVPVLDQDTPESLAERVLAVEHEKYAEALQLIAEGRVKVDGRRVRIAGK